MGAFFRNVEGILRLTGCNCLTISPKLLNESAKSNNPTAKNVGTDASVPKDDIKKIDKNGDTFCWMMKQDAMATEKLAEGIRGFGADIESLDKALR